MESLSKGMDVAFIGLGVMGSAMAEHLLRAGHGLIVHTRTREKARPLLERGAIWRESPGAAAAASRAVITMVGFPADVEAVYFGTEGILRGARPGAFLIDMTTSRPSLARRIAREAQARGIHALDAPVSGGDVGAREARLSVMVGGSREAFASCLPLFECMGKHIVHQGGPGNGQHAKMCNQIAVAASMLGACEALAYAEKNGLRPETVLQSISAGAAGSWTLDNLAPRMLRGDFRPGFYVRHFVKDLEIALEETAAAGLELPGLELAKRLYDRLVAEGMGMLGTHALYRLYGG